MYLVQPLIFVTTPLKLFWYCCGKHMLLIAVVRATFPL